MSTTEGGPQSPLSPAGQVTDPESSKRGTEAADQAFMAQIRGISRPGAGKFGPDRAFYLVDFGVVRNGGESGTTSGGMDPAAAAVAQIPGTGVIWPLSRD